VWSLARQAKVVEENQARGQAARSTAAALAQLLEERVRERRLALQAVLESNRLYRAGLLVQSEATVKSTMVQFQVGRVAFASVLEALSGYLADVDGFFESIAAGQRITIAQREISLEAPAGMGSGRGTQSVPGAGAVSASVGGTRAEAQAPAATGQGAGASMSRM
jgi:cobalt-zinc-cadmium efflux system outer membrane protein